MGFGDFLKKATDKANDLVKSGAETLEQTKKNAQEKLETFSSEMKKKYEEMEAEAEQKRKQREAAEAEEKARQEELRIKEAEERAKREAEMAERKRLKAEKEKEDLIKIEEYRKAFVDSLTASCCDKGDWDCCWVNHRFYCTCDDCVECERKKYVATKDYGEPLRHPELWPYMKLIEAADKGTKAEIEYPLHPEFVEWLKKENNTPDANIFDDQGYPDLNIVNSNLERKEMIRRKVEEMESFHIAPITENDIFDMIVENLLSNFDKDLFYISEDLHNIDAFLVCNISNDPLLNLLLDLKCCPKGFDREKLHILSSFIYKIDINMSYDHEIFKNPSLYDRTLEEFTYAIFIIYLLIRSVSPDNKEISIDKLIDAEGNLKPSGIGGAEKGHYGDTIWNNVVAWSNDSDFDISSLNKMDLSILF